MDDLISRQAAIDVFNTDAELFRRALYNADIVGVERAKYDWGLDLIELYIDDMKKLPSAQPETPCYLGSPCEYQNPDVVISQPEPSISLSWIKEHIEWLKSLDNEFANLAATHISVMVKKWRSEQE